MDAVDQTEVEDAHRPQALARLLDPHARSEEVMGSITPAAPGTGAARAWVAAFAEGWLAPAGADAFADHFQRWFDPDIRLLQPQLPMLVGHHAFRERFARPLFALIPDLHGQVERSAVDADCAYVELTLRGTLGGRPVAWRVCDRTTLHTGSWSSGRATSTRRHCCGPSSPAPEPGQRSPGHGGPISGTGLTGRMNAMPPRIARQLTQQRTEPREDDMRKAMAAVGSLTHFVLQPGVVAGLVPWWLTGWRVRQPLPGWALAPLRVAGLALLAAGVLVLLHAFIRFVGEGVGTPAPIAPTQQLVVGGPYRYVRNPMYLAVTAIIVGQALALGQSGLLLYAAIVGGAMVAFASGYEEPALARQFGAQYEAYRRG